MNWYRKSLSIKLILGFVLVAIIAGIIGTLGYVGISTVNAGYSSAYTNYGIALGDLGEIGVIYQKIRVTLRDVIIDGKINKETYIAAFEEYGAAIEAAFAEFESKIQTDSEKTAFEALKQSYTKFEALSTKVTNYVFAGQDAKALALMRGDALKEAQSLQTAMDSLFESKRSDGTAKSTALTNQANLTKNATLAIIAFGMFLAILLGIIFSKMMTKPINHLVSVAE